MTDLVWQRAAQKIYRSHGELIKYILNDRAQISVLAIVQPEKDIELKNLKSVNSIKFLKVLEKPPEVEKVVFRKKDYSLGSVRPTGEGEWQIGLSPSLSPKPINVSYGTCIV